jgi:ubiquinone/menaquinone biosynthesis C-methylase UbiE
MIEGAVRLNRQGERCHFHHNSAPDLRLFPDRSFDFVLSLLVFQHMEPALMKGYLREFVRVLDSDGVAYFNIPDRYALGTELAPAAARASIECIEMRPAL